jgi:type II secretory pathway component PulJ
MFLILSIAILALILTIALGFYRSYQQRKSTRKYLARVIKGYRS